MISRGEFGPIACDPVESDRAIADFTKAIEINLQDADAYNNRGTAYVGKGEIDRAIADYSRAIEINPRRQAYRLAPSEIGPRKPSKGGAPSPTNVGAFWLDGVEPGCGGRGEVEGPAGMAGRPCAHLGMSVGGIVVDDCVDRLSRRHLRLDGIEEADELLMAVALHVVSDDGGCHCEGGESWTKGA